MREGKVTHRQHFDVCIRRQKASQRITKNTQHRIHSDCIEKDGGVRPGFVSCPDPALGDSSLCSSAPPPHTLTCTAQASSPLCSAVLGSRSFCCLRGRCSQGSGSEQGVLSSMAACDWAPGCVLGGVCGAGLPCFLFIPSWADPSMGTPTWSMHWASRAGGW